MNQKEYKNTDSKIFRCWTCKHQQRISKSGISPGGTQQYIITCKKEMCTFELDWNAHTMDTLCRGESYKNE